MANDPFNPDDVTDEEQNAKALARNDLEMLSKLVRLRHELGLTQEDVAKAIGRDKSAVSRFERLDSDPRLSTVRRYARAVGAIIEHRVGEFDGCRTVHENIFDVTFAWPTTELRVSEGIRFVKATTLPSPEFEAVSAFFGSSHWHDRAGESDTAATPDRLEDEAPVTWWPRGVSRESV